MSKLVIIFIIYLVLYTIFKKISRQAQKQRQQAAPPPPVEEEEDEDEYEESEPVAESAAPDKGGSVFEQLFGIQQASDGLKKRLQARKMAAAPKPAPAPPSPPRVVPTAPRPHPTRVKVSKAEKPFYRSLNPAKLKQGIILSEILGPCLANREPGIGKYY